MQINEKTNNKKQKKSGELKQPQLSLVRESKSHGKQKATESKMGKQNP